MSKLISQSVNIPFDISKLVKKYIQNQTVSEQPPFAHSTSKKQSSFPKKQSLSDWRILFNQKKAKTIKRQHTSDRKFDRILSSSNQRRTGREDKLTVRTGNTRINQNKTSASFRETFLDSALMQNYYEGQYIDQRRIQTAKVRRHYQKSHEKRPSSINSQNHRQNKQQKSHNCQKSATEIVPFKIKRKNRNGYLNIDQIWPQKYDNVQIRRKHIRKCNDIIIEGLQEMKNDSYVEGFRYYDKNL